MLTAPAFWYQCALVSALVGLILLLPLTRLFPSASFRAARRDIGMGAAIFWLGFAALLTRLTWTGYYQFFYPAWMKWGLLAIALIVFPGLAFAFHWLACRLPGPALAWFCLFAGLESVGEHTIAWYTADLPTRVPMLADAPLIPILVFAFFEYIVYWAIALWIAWLLTRVKFYKKSSSVSSTE
jgi:hypothetical protein